MADFNNWQFDITDIGRSDLERLDKEVKKQILEKLKWFTDNFQIVIPLPLGGHWRGFFKLRVGDWRIVYEVNHNARLITVHAIDNRDKIYKRRR